MKRILAISAVAILLILGVSVTAYATSNSRGPSHTDTYQMRYEDIRLTNAGTSYQLWVECASTEQALTASSHGYDGSVTWGQGEMAGADISIERQSSYQFRTTYSNLNTGHNYHFVTVVVCRS